MYVCFIDIIKFIYALLPKSNNILRNWLLLINVLFIFHRYEWKSERSIDVIGIERFTEKPDQEDELLKVCRVAKRFQKN